LKYFLDFEGTIIRTLSNIWKKLKLNIKNYIPILYKWKN
jgi:hypothetical protein